MTPSDIANLVIDACFFLAHAGKIGHIEVRRQSEIVPNVVKAAPKGGGVHGQDQRSEPRGLRAVDKTLGDLPVLGEGGTTDLGPDRHLIFPQDTAQCSVTYSVNGRVSLSAFLGVPLASWLSCSQTAAALLPFK